MQNSNISQAYILGIREARALHKTILRLEGTITSDRIKSELEASKTLKKQFSADMKELFRGEVDYWHNLLKRA